MNRGWYPLWFLRYVGDGWRMRPLVAIVRDRPKYNCPRFDWMLGPRAFAD